MPENPHRDASRILLDSRLRYHHRCLREDATNPELTSLERLTLVRDRAKRMWEIERELDAMKGTATKRRPNFSR
jgi:hypothetical protein